MAFAIVAFGVACVVLVSVKLSSLAQTAEIGANASSVVITAPTSVAMVGIIASCSSRVSVGCGSM